MIANEQFAALMGLLIEKKVCTGQEAAAFLGGLAERLCAPAHSEWQLNQWELCLHAEWLKRLGARLWARRS